MKTQLETIVGKQQGWVELRYHRRLLNDLTVQKGRVDIANSTVIAGIGVRVLENGCWGFASTVDLSSAAIERAIDSARANAREVSKIQAKKIPDLPATELSRDEIVMEGYNDLLRKPLDEKLAMVVDMERETLGRSSKILTAISSYREMFEDKIIVTSDGASAAHKLVRPELRLTAIASQDGEQIAARNNLGVTGGWNCLFDHHRAQNIVENTAREAVELLSAPYITGGTATCILAPSIVGLLSHEAIGHTVEADFVIAGSVAQGQIGKRVGSELVTMCDSSASELGEFAAGEIPFDDEGVPARKTTIIDKGIMKSYLHNRESAVHFGVEPTGNARAWLYHDEPLIRMRNTYIEPGEQTLEEIIASTPEGYLLMGAGSGQADATGEFMFGSDYAVEIKDGKLGKKFREVTISGVAFDVLKSVDAVSSEFQWDLGSGYCGKGQPAKVDAGGPYVRCRIMLGGRQ
ncbi:MAG: TldD/PmbA family protein [bacterium]|nr:TldD/PmbA family protein [bacterium]